MGFPTFFLPLTDFNSKVICPGLWTYCPPGVTDTFIVIADDPLAEYVLSYAQVFRQY